LSSEPIPLLEREADVEAIARRLDAARQENGAIVVVEGPAGVGKSRLLAAARDRAREQDMRVLSARGSRLERDLAFGVAHQLLAPILSSGEQPEALAAAALDPISTGRMGAAEVEPTFSVLHALHELVAAAAAREPLLLAVDDLPLVDSPSLRMLAYTARRLGDLPIALVVAARPAEGGLRSEAVEDVLAEPDALLLRPALLSAPAVQRALEAGLGAAVDPVFADAAHELAGGNPAQLSRLVRELGATGVEPTADGVARLQEAAGQALTGTRRTPRPAATGTSATGAPDEAAEASLALVEARELALDGRAAEAARRAQDAVARLETRHPSLGFRLEAELAVIARIGLHVRHRNLQRLRDLARDLARDDPAARLLVANLALDGTLRGEPAASVGTLAEVAWASGRLLADEGPSAPAVHAVAAVLGVAGREDVSAQVLGATLAEARARQSSAAEALSLLLRAEIRLRRGSLAEAEEDARAALALAALPGAAAAGAPAAACLANVLVVCDRLDEAEAVLEAAMPAPGAAEPPMLDSVLYARGRLRMAQGRPEDASGDLLACGRRMDARGVRNPALIPWRSAAAIALVQLGQNQRARELAREELELSRAFGAPISLGFTTCQAGLAIGGAEGLELLRRSVSVLGGQDAPLPEAVALVELGGALRRAGLRVEARDHLRRAQRLAEHSGAVRVARRARDELVAAGARPRRAEMSGPRSLTFSERRAAQLAADGWPNRRIAQELYVTPKTVEMHLTNAYRKLGITSRTQLREALRADEDADADGHLAATGVEARVATPELHRR
jgi:DNA-binding NarL/FixJ family response regulator